MEKKNQNRETWCGYRPSVMPAKKKSKKHERKEGKQICRNAIERGERLMAIYKVWARVEYDDIEANSEEEAFIIASEAAMNGGSWEFYIEKLED